MPNISQVRIAVFLIVFLQSCATKALGENSLQKIEAQPSNTEIARIEQRGKEIAEYERTAIQSTDLTLAANPDLSKLELYVAQKEQSTWWAYYGKLSENDEEFQIAYNYACTDKSCILQTARSVTKELIVLAKAIKLSLNALRTETTHPKWNSNVFREADGTLSVYLMPGNTDANVFLIGGDYKFSVSSDASHIMSKNRIHKSFIKIAKRGPKGEPIASTLHSHTIGNDLPTETDVAHVILHSQLAPHYIVGPVWFSRIDQNGKISILGKTEDYLKGQKNKSN